MQWNSDVNGGFSKGVPWINSIKNYKEINVKQQLEDRDSILNYYKELISLRKKYLVLSEGEFIPLKDNQKGTYIYKRKYNNEEILVITNFKDKKEITLPMEEINKNYTCILSNNNQKISLKNKLKLEPYDAYIFYKKNK